ncbi:hypothetical protein GGX14DRAFT_403629 [Mycena pura]|uniref:Uncharacterized protein n=1 Tax=Mycena pura TaxID=153505 RepID=A0AAD6Y635_9AGAR|nr:hypothetical protein GGX14DRAFT_403629 [Mycena pura]
MAQPTTSDLGVTQARTRVHRHSNRRLRAEHVQNMCSSSQKDIMCPHMAMACTCLAGTLIADPPANIMGTCKYHLDCVHLKSVVQDYSCLAADLDDASDTVVELGQVLGDPATKHRGYFLMGTDQGEFWGIGGHITSTGTQTRLGLGFTSEPHLSNFRG